MPSCFFCHYISKEQSFNQICFFNIISRYTYVVVVLFKGFAVIEKVHGFLLVPALKVGEEIDTPSEVSIIVFSLFGAAFLIAIATTSWAFTFHSIHHSFHLHLNL